MGSNSSGLVGQTQRKEPSTFSHRAAPHTPCSVSHSFTSVSKRQRGGRVNGCKRLWFQSSKSLKYPNIMGIFDHPDPLIHLSFENKPWISLGSPLFLHFQLMYFWVGLNLLQVDTSSRHGQPDCCISLVQREGWWPSWASRCQSWDFC